MLDSLWSKLWLMQFWGYLLMGLIQMVATYAAVYHLLGTVAAILFGLFIGWTPIIGSVLSVYGATKVWGWPWYWAILIFFWPNIIVLVLALRRDPR
jgi:hypothetical protein